MLVGLRDLRLISIFFFLSLRHSAYVFVDLLKLTCSVVNQGSVIGIVRETRSVQIGEPTVQSSFQCDLHGARQIKVCFKKENKDKEKRRKKTELTKTENVGKHDAASCKGQMLKA